MSNRATRHTAERRNLRNRRSRSQRARLVDRKLGSKRPLHSHPTESLSAFPLSNQVCQERALAKASNSHSR